MTVKCVAWDLDETLWEGVALEHESVPSAVEGVEDVLDALLERGILNAIVTRNPEEVLELARSHPAFVGRFTAYEAHWGPKSEAVALVADRLELEPARFAYVDADPFERAEVEHALGIPALAPEELRARLGEEPFAPAVVTDEARGRAAAYEAAGRRSEEAARQGSHAEFLRSAGTTITLARAAEADAARVHELAERTTQFNSTGRRYGVDEVEALVASPGHAVATARLRDRFGDDGLVGAAIVERGDETWTVDLLMASCRAANRGVVPALLHWLSEAAAAAGAERIELPVEPTERNVPLRVAVRTAGFRAEDPDARPLRTVRATAPPPPPPEFADLVVDSPLVP